MLETCSDSLLPLSALNTRVKHKVAPGTKRKENVSASTIVRFGAENLAFPASESGEQNHGAPLETGDAPWEDRNQNGN